jgi:hypothetical protein
MQLFYSKCEVCCNHTTVRNNASKRLRLEYVHVKILYPKRIPCTTYSQKKAVNKNWFTRMWWWILVNVSCILYTVILKFRCYSSSMKNRETSKIMQRKKMKEGDHRSMFFFTAECKVVHGHESCHMSRILFFRHQSKSFWKKKLERCRLVIWRFLSCEGDNCSQIRHATTILSFAWKAGRRVDFAWLLCELSVFLFMLKAYSLWTMSGKHVRSMISIMSTT